MRIRAKSNAVHLKEYDCDWGLRRISAVGAKQRSPGRKAWVGRHIEPKPRKGRHRFLRVVVEECLLIELKLGVNQQRVTP